MKEAKEGEFDGVVVDAGVAFYFTVAAEFLNKPVWQAGGTSQIAVKPVQEPVRGVVVLRRHHVWTTNPTEATSPLAVSSS